MAFDRPAYCREYKKRKKVEMLIYKKRYESRIRQELFDLLGRECKRCGFSDMRALQIDHINGDGYKDRGKCRGTSSHKRRILEAIKNGENRYQILCANCNWIKRCENNEHTRFKPSADTEKLSITED